VTNSEQKLGKLFQYVFSRTTPVVEADSPTMVGASLLRFHPVDAALLLIKDLKPARVNSRCLFVSGHSVLAGLVKRNPGDYYKLMFEPCSRSVVGIESLSIDHNLRDLLNLIKETRFGFTTVADGEVVSLVGLLDVVRLYTNGDMETDTVVEDVASPPFYSPRGATLKTAIDKMFERRIRRVFIDGTRAFVSDRELISFIFSPRRLEDARNSPNSVLEPGIEEVGPIDAEEVDDAMPVRDAARLIAQKPGTTLLCGKGVVTPWDLVIKPWTIGRLVLGEESGPKR